MAHVMTRHYTADLMNGLAIDPGDVDEPYIVRIQRRTEGGVGNVLDLTLTEAGELMVSLAEQLAYCASLGEERVMTLTNDA